MGLRVLYCFVFGVSLYGLFGGVEKNIFLLYVNVFIYVYNW